MSYLRECCGPDNGKGGSGRAFRFFKHAIFGLVACVAVATVLGWVTMTAWNAVMPAVFNVPAIAFWPAVGLLVLGRLLTGGFHHRHHGRFGKHKCFTRSFHRSEGRDALDGANFAQWWWEEGEAAFRLYQARKADETKPE